MTEALKPEQLETLKFLLKGEVPAVKLALDLLWVGHLWDDLIDGDRQRAPDEVNRAFALAFCELSVNPFVAALPEVARYQLLGLISSAALQYQTSTQLERGDKDDRFNAFLCRNAILGVIQYLMLLVGGMDWATTHSPELWRTFGLRGAYKEFEDENLQQIGN